MSQSIRIIRLNHIFTNVPDTPCMFIQVDLVDHLTNIKLSLLDWFGLTIDSYPVKEQNFSLTNVGEIMIAEDNLIPFSNYAIVHTLSQKSSSKMR
jgi:hypothetical protein